jgi:hypothetical protein
VFFQVLLSPPSPIDDQRALARIEQISAYRAPSSLFGGSRTRAGRKAEVYYSAEYSHENPFRYSRSRHCDFLLVIS